MSNQKPVFETILEVLGEAIPKRSGRRLRDAVVSCPAHDDPSPSLHITEKTPSQVLYFCHAGCTQEAVRGALVKRGVPADVFSKSLDSGVTLKSYAAYVQLPEDELREAWGLSEKPRNKRPVLVIPYYESSGGEAAKRLRLSLHKAPKFKWDTKKAKTPSPLPLYGLRRLGEIREKGWVVLVEGESDVQTLWHHGIPALGVPGASVWQPTHARYLEDLTVYVWQEPDTAGYAFTRKVAEKRKDIHIIQAPEGAKDPSALHKRVGKKFDETFGRLVTEAPQFKSLPPPGIKSDAECRVKPYDWLWDQRIALGKINCFFGPRETGKGTILCDIAARLSRENRTMPLKERRAPGARPTVWYGAEDGWEDTVIARYYAAGGKQGHLLTFDARAVPGKDGLASVLELPDDVPVFYEHLKWIGESFGNPGLVVFDPFNAFLSLNVNAWNASQIRRVLTPMKFIIEELGWAAVVLAHPIKYRKSAASAMDLLAESHAFGDVLRMAWCVVDDPSAPTTHGLVLPAKGSIVARDQLSEAGLRFEWESPLARDILPEWPTSPEYKDQTLPRIKWVGKSSVKARDALTGSVGSSGKITSRDLAETWLREQFQAAPDRTLTNQELANAYDNEYGHVEAKKRPFSLNTAKKKALPELPVEHETIRDEQNAIRGTRWRWVGKSSPMPM